MNQKTNTFPLQFFFRFWSTVTILGCVYAFVWTRVNADITDDTFRYSGWCTVIDTSIWDSTNKVCLIKCYFGNDEKEVSEVIASMSPTNDIKSGDRLYLVNPRFSGKFYYIITDICTNGKQ